MLSTVTSSIIKTLAITDPDIFVIHAIDKVILTTKGIINNIINPFTISIGGIPLTLITLGLGVAIISATVFEYQMKHNDDLSIKVKKSMEDGNFTKKILIISGLITIIIFAL